MKKTNKLFSLLVALGLALVGCSNADENKDGGNTYGNGDNGGNGAATKTDWNNEEKAIISTYFYNQNIPYMYVEGASELEYYADYNQAYSMAETCTKEVLDNYAKLFDDSWTNESSLGGEDGYMYFFTKTISTEDGNRYLGVSIYGGVVDIFGSLVPTEDGTGSFIILIQDPYVYSWPAEDIAYLLELYDSESTVPVYQTELYSMQNGIDSGYLGVFCYTDDETSVDEYVAILNAAGYQYYKTDDYDYDCYTNEEGIICISIAYDDEVGTLDIYIEGCEEYDEIDGDVLTQDSFGLTDGNTSYGSYTAVGESGAEYAGFMAARYGIQLNAAKKNNQYCGIVSTVSGGTIEAVAILWNENCYAERTISIYASNSPFTIDNMYDGSLQAVGQITNEYEYDVYEFEAEYTYVGIRVVKSAVYLDEVVFSWAD